MQQESLGPVAPHPRHPHGKSAVIAYESHPLVPHTSCVKPENSTMYCNTREPAGRGSRERAAAFGCNSDCSAKQQACDRSVASTRHTSSRRAMSVRRVSVIPDISSIEGTGLASHEEPPEKQSGEGNGGLGRGGLGGGGEGGRGEDRGGSRSVRAHWLVLATSTGAACAATSSTSSAQSAAGGQQPRRDSSACRAATAPRGSESVCTPPVAQSAAATPSTGT